MAGPVGAGPVRDPAPDPVGRGRRASENPARASYFVAAYLVQSSPYEVHFVNPRAKKILGRPVYRSLDALPVVPDLVDVSRRPSDLAQVLEEVAAVGAKTYWLRLGLWDDAVGRQRFRVVGMDERQRLLDLLEVFESALADLIDLVRDLRDDEWELPTDLPGWSVHDVVSHTAHLEAVLAGAPEETIDVPAGLAHVVSPMGMYTEQGVIARKPRSRAQLLEEIATASTTRLVQTRAHPPDARSGAPPRTPGGIGWNWLTLLSNRPLDVYLHEQDIRRATGRSGNLYTPAGRHTVAVFGRGLGFVLGKRAQAQPGQTLAVELTDSPVDWPSRFVVAVGESGRGGPAPDGAVPDATLRMDIETFLVLSGGRRAPKSQQVAVHGDDDLATRVLAGMATTP